MAEKFRSDCHEQWYIKQNDFRMIIHKVMHSPQGAKVSDIPTLVGNITEEEDVNDAICTR